MSSGLPLLWGQVLPRTRGVPGAPEGTWFWVRPVVLGLFCLTLETFSWRPSGLLVSHYSLSINLYISRKTDLQSVKYSLVLNRRNLQSIWYYFCWVIVEGFPWSNKYLTCICSPREHEGQPWGPGKEHTVHKKRPLPSSRSWPMWRPARTQAIVIQDAKCSGRPEDSKPGSLQVGPKLGLKRKIFLNWDLEEIRRMQSDEGEEWGQVHSRQSEGRLQFSDLP